MRNLALLLVKENSKNLNCTCFNCDKYNIWPKPWFRSCLEKSCVLANYSWNWELNMMVNQCETQFH